VPEPAPPAVSDRTPSVADPTPSFADRLFAGLQVALPHHLLSRLAFRLARARLRPLKDLLIAAFRRAYPVDLAEAAEPDPRAYPTFHAFFTRPLRAGARPVVAGEGEVACPVDGAVSRAGEIAGGRAVQAKGREFSVRELLGGDPGRAAPFAGGAFATLYLAPRDYHRIHMPLDGRLRETVHVPGRRFAVNPRTVRTVPRLFARNERLAAIFDTEAGRMALVLVGALLVGSIETAWGGPVTPAASPSPRGRREVHARDYGGFGAKGAEVVVLERGQELGRFAMGSTVIVLFEPGRVAWDPAIVPGARVRMGALLGRVARR
jgi:phosphatidylserine decarboxylase